MCHRAKCYFSKDEVNFEDSEESYSEISSECSEIDAEQEDQGQTKWSDNISVPERECFSGKRGVQTIKDITVDGQPSLLSIYFQIVNEDVLRLMVEQTNLYAEQHIRSQETVKGRARRWTNTTVEEMKKFLGILLFTGVVSYPRLEFYWKKDPLYYHPLLHNVGMSYNRFSNLLRFWHFVDNAMPPTRRLNKVQPLVDLIISNSRALYYPGDTVIVDDLMIPFREKIYKLCSVEGYTWSFEACTDDPNQNILGLGKPGSIVVRLLGELINTGRLVIADNYYTSLPLARFLKANKSDLCGTIRANRTGIKKEISKIKLRKNEAVMLQKDEIIIMKWRDKRNVLMISTCFGGKSTTTSNRNKTKPEMLEKYNAARKSIDTSDQLSSYYSPLHKSLIWYKKIAYELLFGVAIVNTYIIYNEMQSDKRNKLTVLEVKERIIREFLKISNEDSNKSLIGNTRQQHFLTELPRKGNKLHRKRCHGCYENLKQHNDDPRKKAKQVHQECTICKKPYCLQCFQEAHK